MRNSKNRAEEVKLMTERNKNKKQISSTGYKGVYKREGCYQASLEIAVSGKRSYIHLGTYVTPQEASKARTEYLKSLI